MINLIAVLIGMRAIKYFFSGDQSGDQKMTLTWLMGDQKSVERRLISDQWAIN